MNACYLREFRYIALCKPFSFFDNKFIFLYGFSFVYGRNLISGFLFSFFSLNFVKRKVRHYAIFYKVEYCASCRAVFRNHSIKAIKHNTLCFFFVHNILRFYLSFDIKLKIPYQYLFGFFIQKLRFKGCVYHAY